MRNQLDPVRDASAREQRRRRVRIVLGSVGAAGRGVAQGELTPRSLAGSGVDKGTIAQLLQNASRGG